MFAKDHYTIRITNNCGKTKDFAAENPSNAGSDMRRRPALVGKLSREINLQTAAKPALST